MPRLDCDCAALLEAPTRRRNLPRPRTVAAACKSRADVPMRMASSTRAGTASSWSTCSSSGSGSGSSTGPLQEAQTSFGRSPSVPALISSHNPVVIYRCATRSALGSAYGEWRCECAVRERRDVGGTSRCSEADSQNAERGIKEWDAHLIAPALATASGMPANCEAAPAGGCEPRVGPPNGSRRGRQLWFEHFHPPEASRPRPLLVAAHRRRRHAQDFHEIPARASSCCRHSEL